jgi:hypothetical protein
LQEALGTYAHPFQKKPLEVVLAKVHVPRYVRQAWLVLCVFPQVPDRRGDPIVSMLFSCHGPKVGAYTR